MNIDHKQRLIATIDLEHGIGTIGFEAPLVLAYLQELLAKQDMIAGSFPTELIGNKEHIYDIFGESNISVQLHIGRDVCQFFISNQQSPDGPKLRVDRKNGKAVIVALNQEGINLLVDMHGGGARAIFNISQTPESVQSEAEVVPCILPIEQYEVEYIRDGKIYHEYLRTRKEIIELYSDPNTHNINTHFSAKEEKVQPE